MKSPFNRKRICVYCAALTLSFCAWGVDTTSTRLRTETFPKTVTESHRQSCIRREAERKAQDDWDKSHPGQRKKSYEQIRQEAQAATACGRDDISRALEEDDYIEKRGTAKAASAIIPKKIDSAASSNRAVPKDSIVPSTKQQNPIQ